MNVPKGIAHRPAHSPVFGRWTLAAGLLLAASSASAAEPPPPLREARLRLLYAESLFLTVNRNDALAAIKIWVETLGRRRGFMLTVETGFYDRVEEAAKRIQEDTVDMITCTSQDCLQLATRGQIDPAFIPGWSQASDDYVVLTRRDRNFATLADLRGKSVLFYRVGSGLGRRWMDAVLGESGLGSASDFFGANSESTKVSGVVLPVFFGKTEVAVAKRYGWETMKEMNPQLAVQLQILAHSPHLPDAVVCLLDRNRNHPFRDDLIRGTAEMSDDPQGQQILLLFKTDRMVPFKPEHLDAVRALMAKPAGPEGRPERAAAAIPPGGEAKP